MGDKSKIEWTEATWNPIAGCSLVSEGCRNCYAMRVAERMAGFGQEKYRGLTHRVNGHPVWTGEIRLDEKAAGVPFFFKQWGEWIPVFGQRHGLKIHQHFEFPDGLVVGRVGKKAAGRLLDGREWNQYPETEMAVTA